MKVFYFFKRLGLRLGLAKRSGFMSGLTLAVAITTRRNLESGSGVAPWRLSLQS